MVYILQSIVNLFVNPSSAFVPKAVSPRILRYLLITEHPGTSLKKHFL